MKEEKLLWKLKLIFETDRLEVEKEFGKIFYQYYRRYFKDNLRLVGMFNETRHILDVTGAKDKKVLDLGCGFGLMAISLKACGAREVVGIDIGQEKIEVFQKLLSRNTPFSERVEASVCHSSKIDYADEFFDVVIAREVISHARDSEVLFKEVKRVLKKKGIFFIKDDNNALDIRGRLGRRKLWNRFEHGPIINIGLEKPYRLMRKEMIINRHPHLKIEDLNLLLEATMGMWGEEVFRAVDKFLEEGILPKRQGFKFRNPKTGECAEREFNPYRLKNTLERCGYKVKVIRPFYSYTYSGGRGILLNSLGKIISFFHPLSLCVAPTFEIVAEKL